MTIEQCQLVDRPLTKAEINEASVLAVRGFYTDPFFVHLAPKSIQRSLGLTYFFRTMLRHGGRGARVVTVREQGRIVGLAAWYPPGGYPLSVATQLAQIPGSARAFYRSRRAMSDGNRYLAAAAKSHVKEPHWYLQLFVADPEMQRRGVGQMMMDWALPQIDEQALPSYLETQKFDNLAYYRRFGFELRETLRPVKDGPPLYTMYRPAR